MHRNVLGFVPLVIVALVPLAAAQAPKSDGELWEITTRIDIAGSPMAVPPATQRICMPRAAKSEQFVPKQNGECKLVESRTSGATHRFTMVCGGNDPITSEGEIRHSGNAFEGRMRTTAKTDGDAMDITQTFSGRNVGPCSTPVGG